MKRNWRIFSTSLLLAFFSTFQASAQVCDTLEYELGQYQGLSEENIKLLSAAKIPANAVVNVKLKSIDDYRQKPPKFKAPEQTPRELNIEDLHFMQITASNRTKDGQYTVLDNARQFRDGELKVDDLPTINVWMDDSGRIWTLDHRRLVSMALSGVVKRVPVQWANANAVEKQSFKYSTPNEGESIFVKLDSGHYIEVTTGVNGRSPGLILPQNSRMLPLITGP